MDPIVNQINLYPVKSLKGISVETARVQHRGLQDDRRWMVVDSDGKLLSQREVARMALVSVAIDEDPWTLSAPGMPPVPLTLATIDGPTVDVRVWRSTCPALVASDTANEALSSILGVSCRLVYMPDETRRTVNPDFAAGEGIVSFADGYPLMLIGQASLDDLNARLETPLPMNRFRPNLVVSGTEPYAEDSWKAVRIGDVALKIAKPCDRCVMTTIDQSLGERIGEEPLRTLARYRLVNQKVVFGMFLIPLREGIIRLGDAVEILTSDSAS